MEITPVAMPAASAISHSEVVPLVFALAQGIFFAGVAAALAMSLGTAVTTGALAALAVGADLALPPALLAERKDPGFYREWLDSFFARDIQRLFGFRDINRFNALFEYVLRQSGGQLETSRTATALGISRATVDSHLQALEITQALTLVRPFHGGGQLCVELCKRSGVHGQLLLRRHECDVCWTADLLRRWRAHGQPLGDY